MKLNLIYRISNGSYDKKRLGTKEDCLRNFLYTFMDWETDQLIVFKDNCNAETSRMISDAVGYGESTKRIKTPGLSYMLYDIVAGSSAQSFNVALDFALMNIASGEYVYLVEDDYFHWPTSRKVMEEGLQRAHYVSLYDHPDKYLDGDRGGNPHVDDGGEITRVFKTDTCHWKLTNSTTMTFATRIDILRADESTWRKHTTGQYPRDFDAFIELRYKGRTLATPIPGYSTHAETAWLSPFRDWSSL